MRKSPRSARLVVLAAAVLVVAMVAAMPASAFAAKAATRIVATKTTTVYRDTPGVNPWPSSLTAKLQRKSSGKYRAYVGTVKLYWFNPATKAYVLMSSKKGSTVSFSIAQRGRYKLRFSGSSKAKASTAYSDFYESVGLTLGSPTVSIEAIPATTKYWVNVSYPVSWNTEAFAGPATVSYEAYFDDGVNEAGWVTYYRDVTAPGTVEYNYKVEGAELLTTLNTWGSAFVEDYLGGSHILTPATAEYSRSTF